MVIRDEIHVLYVKGWCAVVRRCVRNTLHSPIIFVKKVIFFAKLVWSTVVDSTVNVLLYSEIVLSST